MRERPIKFCACGCGKQIPPDEVYPDKGPQFLDECWFRRKDVRECPVERPKGKRHG